MKKRIMKLTWGGKLMCSAVLMLAAIISPVMAQDGFKIWTAAASTGTVDDDDLNEIGLNGPFATFKAGAPAVARATIRYNVVAVDGLFTSGGPALSWPALTVRYRDDGPDARVLVFLRESDLVTGVTQTRITFDSDLYPADDLYQTRAIGNCGNFSAFEFSDESTARAYYLEAVIIRDNASGRPGLAGLALSKFGVCLAP
jgi:hypothetical protein